MAARVRAGSRPEGSCERASAGTSGAAPASARKIAASSMKVRPASSLPVSSRWMAIAATTQPVNEVALL
jgi:hypothetical protein